MGAIMNWEVQRVHEDAKAALVAHFLALPVKDRYLRFGAPFAPTALASYVDRIDFGRDAVFGIHDDRRALKGVAHLAFEGELAELALSVLPLHRRQGFGSAMTRRSVAHARNRGAPGLVLYFVPGNVPITRIARKFGMAVRTTSGAAEAHLALQPPLPSSSGGSHPATEETNWASRRNSAAAFAR
jgi:GNAT superfamily N-acetyltransferase